MLNVQFSNYFISTFIAAQTLLCCCEVIKAKNFITELKPQSIDSGQTLSVVIGGFYMKNVTQNMMFIGRLIEAPRTSYIMLMKGLFFPPTSHFLPPLFLAEACHFPSPTQYHESMKPSSFPLQHGENVKKKKI